MRVVEVGGSDVANACHWNFRGLDGAAKGDPGKNRNLVASVKPVNIQAGISLSVTGSLRLFQCMRKLDSVLLHLRENVIARAVHNPVNSLDSVRRQGFRDGANYRHSPCNRGLNSQWKVLFLCQGENFVAMQGDEGFVSRDYCLTVLQTAAHYITRD